MKSKVLLVLVVSVLLVAIIPLNSQCQDEPTPTPTEEPTASPSPTATPHPTATHKPSPSPTESTDEPTPHATRRPTGSPKGALAGTNWLFIGEIAAAVAVVCVAGFSAFVLLRRRGTSEKKLRRLSSNEFNTWVLKRLAGKPPSSMDTSLGIDGFTSAGYPLSIKQSDSVGMNHIDLFAASVARSKARNGVIVAFGFSDDAIRGKVRAKRNGLDIEMLTIQELIDKRRPY